LRADAAQPCSRNVKMPLWEARLQLARSIERESELKDDLMSLMRRSAREREKKFDP